MKNSNLYKVNIIFGLIMSFMVSILMSIYLYYHIISLDIFVIIVGGIFLWPSSLAIAYWSNKANLDHVDKNAHAPVKLSIFISITISLILIMYDFYMNASLTWSYYPIATIALWPIGMIIYNFLLEKMKNGDN